VPDADDLLPLVVPGVEEELRVLGDHAPEQSLQYVAFVQERRIRRRKKAGRVREFAGPLDTGGEVERHVKRSLARGLAQASRLLAGRLSRRPRGGVLWAP
jgi:hypothetical protein